MTFQALYKTDTRKNHLLLLFRKVKMYLFVKTDTVTQYPFCQSWKYQLRHNRAPQRKNERIFSAGQLHRVRANPLNPAHIFEKSCTKSHGGRAAQKSFYNKKLNEKARRASEQGRTIWQGSSSRADIKSLGKWEPSRVRSTGKRTRTRARTSSREAPHAHRIKREQRERTRVI